MDNVSVDPFKAKPSNPPLPPVPPRSVITSKANTQPPTAATIPVAVSVVKTNPPSSPEPIATTQKAVVIRTMRNDLDEIRSAPVAPPSRTQSATVANTQKPVDMGASRPMFAPVSSQGQSEKVVSMPVKNSKGSPMVKIVVGVIALLAALGGGVGAAMYLGLLQLPSFSAPQPVITQEEKKELFEVIPANASLVVEYKVDSATSRKNIIDTWNAQSENTASLITLLGGDPRMLLESYETVTTFAYVVLPGDSRPYLIIPKQEDTDRLFNESLKGRFIEKNGWYIGHAITASPYETALSQGILNEPLAQQPFVGAMRIIMETEGVNDVVQSTFGSNYVPLNANKIALYTDMQLVNSHVVFQGLAEPIAEVNSPEYIVGKEELLRSVPADADYIKMGNNLAIDTQYVMQKTTLVDSSILDRPSVKQLLKDLSQSYIYYGRTGVDGIKDMGIVIMIPPTLRASLQNGNKSVEEALLAIVPIITGQRQQAQLTFTDGVYKNVPLKYVNITGQDRALDYTIKDGILLIATSKEGMLASLDANLSPPGSTTSNWRNAMALTIPSTTSQSIAYGKLLSSILNTFVPAKEGKEASYVVNTDKQLPSTQFRAVSGVIAY